jgi:acetyl esterase/lipase
MKNAKLLLVMVFAACLPGAHFSGFAQAASPATGESTAPSKPNLKTHYSGLEFARPEGKALKMDLYLPKDPTNDLPVMISIPGMTWEENTRRRPKILHLLKLGIAVASIEYRSPRTAAFPAQVHDCKAAVRWLRANANQYGLDAEAIGVYGAGAGGHLAAMLGTTGKVSEFDGDANLGPSSKVQAVGVLNAPVNFSLISTNPSFLLDPRNPYAVLVGGALSSREDQVQRANPSRYASRESAPFLIIHSDFNKTIPKMQAILLHQTLIKEGARSNLRLPQGWHTGTLPDEVLNDFYFFVEKSLKHIKPFNRAGY